MAAAFRSLYPIRNNIFTFGSKAANFQILSIVSFVIQWSLFPNFVRKKRSAYKSTDKLGHKSVLYAS